MGKFADTVQEIREKISLGKIVAVGVLAASLIGGGILATTGVWAFNVSGQYVDGNGADGCDGGTGCSSGPACGCDT